MLSNLLLATISNPVVQAEQFTIILLNLKKIHTYIRNIIVESWREMAKTRTNRINSEIKFFFLHKLKFLPQYFKTNNL